mmetsp:Transcript_44566/g.75833  ORF Transcript_44566/g.75833 Transcript_44566/m.75833 type:complete len:229 (+) Transcript_44566:114-800(+)
MQPYRKISIYPLHHTPFTFQGGALVSSCLSLAVVALNFAISFLTVALAEADMALSSRFSASFNDCSVALISARTAGWPRREGGGAGAGGGSSAAAASCAWGGLSYPLGRRRSSHSLTAAPPVATTVALITRWQLPSMSTVLSVGLAPSSSGVRLISLWARLSHSRLGIHGTDPIASSLLFDRSSFVQHPSRGHGTSEAASLPSWLKARFSSTRLRRSSRAGGKVRKRL